MPKLSSVRTNVEKAEKGVWTEYEGIRLLVARYNNAAHKRAIAEGSKPHLERIRAGDSDLNLTIQREAMAGTVLLGWDKLEDDDGKPIPFSQEKALEILKDPRLADLHEHVMAQAMAQRNFREASAGN